MAKNLVKERTMRLMDLSARAELKTAELDEEGVLLAVKEIAGFFRDSVSNLKTSSLNNQECVYFEKCFLFVEYYLLHLGKSPFLFFTLNSIMEEDNRFDMIRCRLNLMDFPNDVNYIQNDWRLLLKEAILCTKKLSAYTQPGIITEQNRDIFFDRSISRMLSSFRRMLNQISEENNFMPYLYDLLFKDELVEKSLGLKIMRACNLAENNAVIYDFLKG
jgi:hypothetical protein